MLPWYVRWCLLGIDAYLRVFGWCGFGMREASELLRRTREEMTAEEWLQAEGERDAGGDAEEGK